MFSNLEEPADMRRERLNGGGKHRIQDVIDDSDWTGSPLTPGFREG
jgi:hypothetical protein